MTDRELSHGDTETDGQTGRRGRAAGGRATGTVARAGRSHADPDPPAVGNPAVFAVRCAYGAATATAPSIQTADAMRLNSPIAVWQDVIMAAPRAHREP
jgi:hypothetical protein